MDIRRDLHLIPLFRDLNEEEKNLVAQIAIPREFRRKQIIFIEGGDKKAIFFIQDGLVKTFKTDVDGNEQIISILQTGDMFPHTGMFNQDPYPASAEALVDSRLIAIPIRAFEQLILDMPTIAMKVIHVLEAKILELQHTLQHFKGHDVNDRIISFILKLADQLGERKGDAIHIELPVTNQELANAIGTTRESVNRLLNQLKKQNILQSSRSEIVILDIEALQSWRA